jgi:hypothetical protein
LHNLDGYTSRGELLRNGGVAEALDRVTSLMQAHGDRSEWRPITATKGSPKHQYPLGGRHRTPFP